MGGNPISLLSRLQSAFKSILTYVHNSDDSCLSKVVMSHRDPYGSICSRKMEEGVWCKMPLLNGRWVSKYDVERKLDPRWDAAHGACIQSDGINEVKGTQRSRQNPGDCFFLDSFLFQYTPEYINFCMCCLPVCLCACVRAHSSLYIDGIHERIELELDC